MNLPQDWKKRSAERSKAYRRMLERGPKNAILKALPKLHEEAFSKIDCLDCGACCSNHSPRFKQPDIKRIAKRLRVKEGELVARHLRLDEDGDYVVKAPPCPFLGDGNVCAIYDDRPSDCRRYPYTEEDVVIKRVPLTLKNAVVCPAVYYVLERLEQTIKF